MPRRQKSCDCVWMQDVQTETLRWAMLAQHDPKLGILGNRDRDENDRFVGQGLVRAKSCREKREEVGKVRVSEGTRPS